MYNNHLTSLNPNQRIIIMSNEQEQQNQDNTNTNAPAAQTAVKTKPAPTPVDELPRWKILLHNDDHNDIDFVITTIVQLTPLDTHEAAQRTHEAHNAGLSLLLTTHKERAELYQQQFTSKNLVVTIESED